MSRTVSVMRSYRADARRVFDAWLDPAIAGRWLFATATRPMTRVSIDARVRGGFRFADGRETGAIDYAGEYVAVDPPRRLAFTLGAREGFGAATLVTVAIEAQGAGCRLALTHEHVPIQDVAPWKARWTGILYGLGATLADARRARAVGKGEPACITC